MKPAKVYIRGRRYKTDTIFTATAIRLGLWDSVHLSLPKNTRGLCEERFPCMGITGA